MILRIMKNENSTVDSYAVFALFGGSWCRRSDWYCDKKVVKIMMKNHGEFLIKTFDV